MAYRIIGGIAFIGLGLLTAGVINAGTGIAIVIGILAIIAGVCLLAGI